jgi:hypothetical protein
MVIDEPKQEPVYDWMQLMVIDEPNQSPSDDNAEVASIGRKSKRYHLVDGILFQ